MDIIIGIIAILFFFGLSIFVHELGHFIVAKKCGLKIDAFAIGMGPALIRKEIDGVDWRICAFPIGGYVALPEMDATGLILAEREGLSRISPAKKIAVAVAGVIMNIILAVIFSVIVTKTGKPGDLDETSSVIGYVVEDSEIYEMGIRTGDEILSVDGKNVDNWVSVATEAAFGKDAVALQLKRGEETFSHIVELKPFIWNIKMLPDMFGLQNTIIGGVLEGYSAEAAGIQKGDVILGVNGKTLHHPGVLSDIIEKNPSKHVDLEIQRGEEILNFTLTPKYDEKYDRSFVGIQWGEQLTVYPSVKTQMQQHYMMIFRVLRAFGDKDTRKQAANAIGGPVQIAKSFWDIKYSLGLLLWFTALINVNLAIMNMLPIPVLDGGHVCFAMWEWITGRPVHQKIVLGLTQACVILLLTFMVLITMRDINRNFIKGMVPDGVVSEEITTEKTESNTAPTEPATP